MSLTFEYQFSNLSKDLNEYSRRHDNFDDVYRKKWTELHKIPGVFRYTLAIQNEKILPGKYEFLLQLNPDRSSKRRLPEEIKSLKQKFDPNKFNFNKISDAENLFQIKQTKTQESSRDMLVINSSPICFGHSLLCPNIEDCLPQVITLRSLILATHIMFISSNGNLRIGFNSLCAMASVNHLHYHLLILNHRLPTETVKCHHLKGPVYTITEDYPAQGFCFQIKKKGEIDSVCLHVYKLTSFLLDNNIAHNLYMMSGDSLDGSPDSVLRIFVWARESSVGIKDLSGISLAVCEFSGHFPVRSSDEFDKLTSEFLKDILQESTKSVFLNIQSQVVGLYS